MFGRMVLFIFCAAVVYAANASAAVQKTVWKIDGTTSDTLTLENDPAIKGEEFIYLNIDGNEKKIKSEDQGNGNFSGELILTDDKNQDIERLSIDLMTGTAYEQILALLEDENFRASFEYIPPSCPAEASAFFILIDGMDEGKSYGYCLIKQ